jgi:hypothetical protein
VRKVVQIAVSGETEQTSWNLFALCNDGTIWHRMPNKDTWTRVEDIPQESDD